MTHLDSLPGDVLRLAANYLKPRYEISDLETKEYEKQRAQSSSADLLRRLTIQEGGDAVNIEEKYFRETHLYCSDTFNERKIEKWVGIFKIKFGDSTVSLKFNYIWIDRKDLGSFWECPILQFVRNVRDNIDAYLKVNEESTILYDSMERKLHVVNSSSIYATTNIILEGELIENVLKWLEHIQNRTPTGKFISGWA